MADLPGYGDRGCLYAFRFALPGQADRRRSGAGAHVQQDCANTARSAPPLDNTLEPGLSYGKRGTAMYTMNVLSLWLSGKVDFRTVIHALRHRPSGVAGRGGSYHVDPIDPNE